MSCFSFFFFFNDTATTEIYTLSYTTLFRSLHIGNYLGAVKNWVELQHKYESFFCIVDYHAITVPYEPADLRARTADMALSLFAVGLDPSKCTVFVQSRVPEHTELAWIFNTITPLG